MTERKCEEFDGSVVKEFSFETTAAHWTGALGVFFWMPIVVGGGPYPFSNKGWTEVLTENGWKAIVSHPR